EADSPVRETRAALVEADQARERSEPLEEVGVRRIPPVDLEVREEPGDEDQVERSVAGQLVGDVDVAAPRVPNGVCHFEQDSTSTGAMAVEAGGRLCRPGGQVRAAGTRR